jgi:16S rRNA (cytosine1402-N4)-methyltransferase
MEKYHRSVLLREVLEALQPGSGKVFADVTFGEGGHSEAILDAGASRVIGVDRDAEALEIYRSSGARREDPRLRLVHGRFSRFLEVVPDRDLDGILVDLGVSTRQLLRAERGFSFNQAGPLDMRMDATEGGSLEALLAASTAEELAEGFARVADLPRAEPFTRRILEAYHAGRFKTTLDLAAIAGPRRGKTHPATAMFLALRMLVNQEYEEVEQGLPILLQALRPGGRLVVITFHSTEDRLVKRIFQRLAGRCICDEPICRCSRVRTVDWVYKKAVVATAEEMRENPRARSAKLRCVEKL